MSTLYQDIFDVQKINPEGKKFEKVNRLLCKGLTNDVQLLIDINCDIGFKVHEGDKISVAFASSLAMDGSLDDGTNANARGRPRRAWRALRENPARTGLRMLARGTAAALLTRTRRRAPSMSTASC